MTITIRQRRKEYRDRQNDPSRHKDDNEDEKEPPYPFEEKRGTVESGQGGGTGVIEEGPYRLASGLSLDTPFSGSQQPAAGLASPSVLTGTQTKLRTREKGQSVGCSSTGALVNRTVWWPGGKFFVSSVSSWTDCDNKKWKRLVAFSKQHPYPLFKRKLDLFFWIYCYSFKNVSVQRAGFGRIIFWMRKIRIFEIDCLFDFESNGKGDRYGNSVKRREKSILVPM